jgi:hypothetical protein
VPWLLESYRTAWRDPLAARDEPGWWRPIGPRFGAYAGDSVADLALHVVDEVVHHGAEAALMRDLFVHRDGGGFSLRFGARGQAPFV